MRVGVIDVGTNSVRLLVADAAPDGGDAARARLRLRDVERDLVITRLGEGVDRDKRLGAEPLRRTVEAIARYAQRARALEAERIRIVATSAVRDAANRDEFSAAVRAATGIEPDVLSGDEEAQLGFAGATLDISAPAPYLVTDIGGGSTELVLGTARAERFVSLDIGSVRLTERHVHSDPPLPHEMEAVRADAAEQLRRGAARVGTDFGTLVGLAGTITTLTAISLGLTGYDRAAIHHARLRRDDVAAIRAKLVAMTSAERRALPAMPRGREDVIVAGAVILEEIFACFGAADLLVSETDILDGTASELARGRTGAAGSESQ
jgi:exopolyphosphatase/guanosine-5'-triphosphate,3'-diphosphate pyrophosphatase